MSFLLVLVVVVVHKRLRKVGFCMGSEWWRRRKWSLMGVVRRRWRIGVVWRRWKTLPGELWRVVVGWRWLGAVVVATL
jgi:hypothetical protein